MTWYESHPPSLKTVYFPTAPAYSYMLFTFCSNSLQDQQCIFYNLCPAFCYSSMSCPTGMYHISRNVSRIVQQMQTIRIKHIFCRCIPTDNLPENLCPFLIILVISKNVCYKNRTSVLCKKIQKLYNSLLISLI